MIKRAAILGLVVAAISMCLPSASQAQLNSGGSNVALSAQLLEVLTLSVSPSTVSFTLVGSGTAAGNSSLTITTTWVLLTTRSTVKLYGYFASSTAALTDGSGHNIPSSAVLGSVNTGTYAAFTATSGFATGSSLQIFSQAVSGASLNLNRTDTLGLEIDTVGLSLPAATYTGTLVLQAQAT